MTAPTVELAPDAEENGLALMLAELVRQNVADHPRKQRDLARLRGRVAIVAEDAGVCVTLVFEDGALRLHDGIAGIPDVAVRADSDDVVTLSRLELTRLGLPNLRGSEVQRVLARSREGAIHVLGALAHPLLLLRLTRLLSVAALLLALGATFAPRFAHGQASAAPQSAEEPAAPAPVAAPPPGDAQTANEVSAMPAPPPSENPDARARELYDLAFLALAEGDRVTASRLLQELAATGHPLARRASALLRTLAASPAGNDLPTTAAAPQPAEEPAAASTNDDGRERPTGMARAETVFAQTLHGIALGAETCLLANCEEAQPWALSLMLGGGAGFGASFYLTKDGIRPGLARALTDGVLFGAWNGFALMYATDAFDQASGDEENQVAGAHLALGQLAGMGLSGLLYSQLEPTTGQVSLTASGGIWTTLVVAQAIGATEPEDFREQEWFWILLATSDLGLVVGGVVASEVPMSASRVLLIDAGGLLGILTGYGVAVLVQGDHSEPGPTLAAGLVGTLTGLALAYHLTDEWDASDDGINARVTAVPLPGGGMAMLTGRW